MWMVRNTTVRWFPVVEQMKIALALGMRGEWRAVVGEISRRLYSDETSYVLRRDLEVPIEIPRAKIHISIRNLQSQDLASLFPASSNALGTEEAKDAAWRQYLLHSEIQKCYVATNDSDLACYMQWLIGKDENKKLQQVEKGFAPLQEGEMLLEGAFTAHYARGQGIMGEAMARIADEGRKYGCRYVYTYVRTDNIASLKGCKNAGFRPYGMRKDKLRGFKKSIELVQLPENSKYSFE